jgi:hypothetical protein
MSFPRSIPLTALSKAQLVCLALLLLTAAAVISGFRHYPRVWRAAETPVTFWAWRNQAPAEADVSAAIHQTNARAIFLRAGQINIQDGKVRRIRPVTGSLPRSIDLHLVYNATRSLLAQLGQVNETALADSISAAYLADVALAERAGSRVIGLQVDIDVPTRLLGRYEKFLGALRHRLTPETKLSITGLPTWMESPELRRVLAQVDFWIPQLYGAEIPERSDQLIPISSVRSVSSYVSQARELDKPFYAGLAAYSYTLLYDSSGSLVTLRGDMDPALIASDRNLELIDQRPFDSQQPATNGLLTSSEWRSVYRATADGMIDDLALHAGDLLVVDQPSAESLRVAARAVRELAGERLLGICVFRLACVDDPAVLTIEQVASALADRDSVANVEVKILSDTQNLSVKQTASITRILEVRNTGTAGSTIGSVKVDLQTTPGTIEIRGPERLSSVEYLCDRGNATSQIDPDPCSQRRANVIRFKPRMLAAGQTVQARLGINPDSLRAIPVLVEMQTDTGQWYRERLEVSVESKSKQ